MLYVSWQSIQLLGYELIFSANLTLDLHVDYTFIKYLVGLNVVL